MALRLSLLYLQVNSFPLDVDTLCDFRNEDSVNSIHMALDEWEKVNSPLAYWYNWVDRFLNMSSPHYNPMEGYEDPSDSYHFFYGLPQKQAEEICRATYKQNIAKVTLEILDPRVVRMKKDLKVTFSSQLGVFGREL